MLRNKNSYIMWFGMLHNDFKNVLLRSLEWLLSIEKTFFQHIKALSLRFKNFANGEFHEHSVNNNCICIQLAHVKIKSTYVKSQTLVYFGFIFSEGKYKDLKMQGFAVYQLYYPEIATLDIANENSFLREQSFLMPDTRAEVNCPGYEKCWRWDPKVWNPWDIQDQGMKTYSIIHPRGHRVWKLLGTF